MSTASQLNRGVGNLATDEYDYNWIKGIKMLEILGDVPITAMMRKFRAVKETQQRFNWWEEEPSEYGGAVTNVYINATLATTYAYGTHQATVGIIGSIVYVKVAAAVAREFKDNDVVILRDVPSVDGGETFLPNIPITDVQFDGNAAGGRRKGGVFSGTPFMGDYTGSATSEGFIISIWCDTRNGTPEAPNSDIYVARITIAPLPEDVPAQ